MQPVKDLAPAPTRISCSGMIPPRYVLTNTVSFSPLELMGWVAWRFYELSILPTEKSYAAPRWMVPKIIQTPMHQAGATI